MKKSNTKVLQYRRIHEDELIGGVHSHRSIVSRVVIDGRYVADRYACLTCPHATEIKRRPKEVAS